MSGVYPIVSQRERGCSDHCLECAWPGALDVLDSGVNSWQFVKGRCKPVSAYRSNGNDWLFGTILVMVFFGVLISPFASTNFWWTRYADWLMPELEDAMFPFNQAADAPFGTLWCLACVTPALPIMILLVDFTFAGYHSSWGWCNQFVDLRCASVRHSLIQLE